MLKTMRQYLVDHEGIQVFLRIFFIIALIVYFEPPEIVFTALCLSLLGDLILIKEGFFTLIMGLFAFLSAHVFYIYHFASINSFAPIYEIPTEHLFVLGGIFAVAIWFVKSMFERDIAAHLKIAVTLYIGALYSLLIVTANERGFAFWGALFFITSDFLIGYDNLIKNQPNKNRPYIMMTYVTAQVFLAASVA